MQLYRFLQFLMKQKSLEIRNSKFGKIRFVTEFEKWYSGSEFEEQNSAVCSNIRQFDPRTIGNYYSRSSIWVQPQRSSSGSLKAVIKWRQDVLFENEGRTEKMAHQVWPNITSISFTNPCQEGWPQWLRQGEATPSTDVPSWSILSSIFQNKWTCW